MAPATTAPMFAKQPTPIPAPNAVGSRMKVCARCKEQGRSEPKMWHQFFRDSNSPDGLGDICKECIEKESIMPTVRKIEITDAKELVKQSDVQNGVRVLRCARCSHEQAKDVFYPEADFYTHSGTKTGYQPYCKACSKKSARERDENKNAQKVVAKPVTKPAIAKPVATKKPAPMITPVTEPVVPVQEIVPSIEAVRVETRQVTMVPAFARAGNMILNLSNVAVIDDSDPNNIEVVLNIHDINKDGIQHPRTFVVVGQDAYALRTAMMAIMGNDEQIQRMANLIKKVEDAAKNETTALELAANAEQQAKSFKSIVDTKDADIVRLQALLDEQIKLRQRAEDDRMSVVEKLNAINKALGR